MALKSVKVIKGYQQNNPKGPEQVRDVGLKQNRIQSGKLQANPTRE